MREVIRSIHRASYAITENNRLTYIYKRDANKKIVEVTCASLEIKVRDKWNTIIYFDSDETHSGILHKHTYVSLEKDADIVDYFGVKRKGSQKKLLEWAIKDIRTNYIVYKKQFIKRLRQTGTDIDVDLY